MDSIAITPRIYHSTTTMSETLVDGIKVNYMEGANFNSSLPTVLLIHGAGQNLTTWKYQLDLLSEESNLNFIAVDLPGHGGSDGEGESTIQGYKEITKKFADVLGLNNLIIVGHSMGGAVAMLYALDHSEELIALVLVDTGPKLSVAAQTLKAVQDDFDKFCEIVSIRALDESSSDRLKQELKNTFQSISPEICRRDLIACDGFNLKERAQEIDVPSLIITGGEDVITPVKYGEYLNDKITGSVLYLIGGAGHFVMQEQPEEFNVILQSFLSRLLADNN